MNDLVARNGLRIALSGKDDVGLDTLARFVLKYAMTPSFSHTLFYVVDMILGMILRNFVHC